MNETDGLRGAPPTEPADSPESWNPEPWNWRILVVGATGVIGGAVATAVRAAGAEVAVAGRDPARLAAVSARLGGCPALAFDAYDLAGCGLLGARAATALGGLDAVVTAFGTVAFGRAEESSDVLDEHLFTVNALAPIAVLRGALGQIGPGGALAAVTGVVASRPSAGMAGYSASKAALGAWLDAVRLEQRRNRVTVLDARFPHLDTGFADRAVAGRPPRLPPGGDLESCVAALVEGLVGAAARRAGADRLRTGHEPGGGAAADGSPGGPAPSAPRPAVGLPRQP
ncbi:SDR family NAD(P)-dependent oxidoreductase [Kitasatospora indigofera]|uniref:SDR family NAD(P)-dependent oxidoreductase n=1 Tax=Kitasatospora indigofera TaxID=67307 RepID=UPI00365E78D5